MRSVRTRSLGLVVAASVAPTIASAAPAASETVENAEVPADSEPAVQASDVPEPTVPEPTVEASEVPEPTVPEPTVETAEVAIEPPDRDPAPPPHETAPVRPAPAAAHVAAPSTPPAASPDRDPGPDAPRWLRPTGVVSIGIGAAMFGLGVTFHVLANRARARYEATWYQQGPTGYSTTTWAEATVLHDFAQRRAIVSGIGYGVAVLSIPFGAVLLETYRRRHADRLELHAEPLPGGGAVFLGGRI